jgi:hypothetical protein
VILRRVVLGTAGVGKTRLVDEALADAGERATVLRGRCLSYGEGITYWPVAEVVHQAAGIADDDTPPQARSKLAALLAGSPGPPPSSSPPGSGRSPETTRPALPTCSVGRPACSQRQTAYARGCSPTSALLRLAGAVLVQAQGGHGRVGSASATGARSAGAFGR